MMDIRSNAWVRALGRGACLGAIICAAAGCVAEEKTRTSFSLEGSAKAEAGSSLRSKIQVLERRVESLPERIDLRTQLAQLYFKDEQYERGIAEIRHAIDKDPANAELYFILGDFYCFMNEFQKAEESYRHVVEHVKPGYSGPRLALGYVLAMQGKHEKAVAEFKEVLKLDPQQVTALYYLGCCYDLMGETDLAIENFRKCAAIESPYAQKARAEIGRLGTLRRGGLLPPPDHFKDEKPPAH